MHSPLIQFSLEHCFRQTLLGAVEKFERISHLRGIRLRSFANFVLDDIFEFLFFSRLSPWLVPPFPAYILLLRGGMVGIRWMGWVIEVEGS